MSGIFPDDAIAAFLAIALHRAADITDPAARDRRANTLVKALTRRVDQPLRFGADWPRRESGGVVTVEAVQSGS